MTMEFLRKKSAPRIGCPTLATRKECDTENPPNRRRSVLVPKVSMYEPLAARRRCPGWAGGSFAPCLTFKNDNGSTEMSAPVSTKKADLEEVSQTDIEPLETEFKDRVPDVIDVRRSRFPGSTGP